MTEFDAATQRDIEDLLLHRIPASKILFFCAGGHPNDWVDVWSTQRIQPILSK